MGVVHEKDVLVLVRDVDKDEHIPLAVSISKQSDSEVWVIHLVLYFLSFIHIFSERFSFLSQQTKFVPLKLKCFTLVRELALLLLRFLFFLL